MTEIEILKFKSSSLNLNSIFYLNHHRLNFKRLLRFSFLILICFSFFFFFFCFCFNSNLLLSNQLLTFKLISTLKPFTSSDPTSFLKSGFIHLNPILQSHSQSSTQWNSDSLTISSSTSWTQFIHSHPQSPLHTYFKPLQTPISVFPNQILLNHLSPQLSDL